jgi:hypothetical protein
MTEFMNSLSTEFNPSTPSSSSTWYGDRGMFLGGLIADQTAYTNQIQYIDITVGGTASDFADLVIASRYRSTFSDGARAAAAGGVAWGAGGIDAIDYWAPSVLNQNAQNFGNLTVEKYAAAGLGDATYGVVAGGYGGSPADNINEIDYVTIQTTGAASNFGTLDRATRGCAGCNDATRGLISGGWFMNNSIDYITVASAGNAAEFGNINIPSNGLEYHAMTSDDTYGLIIGGDTAGGRTSEIGYVTIQTLGNSADFGDLTEAKKFIDATSNGTRGVVGGGNAGTGNGTVSDVIEYVTIATPGIATNFGNLIAGSWDCDAVSGNAA